MKAKTLLTPVVSFVALAMLMASVTDTFAQQVPKMAPYGRGYLEYLPPGYAGSGSQLYPAIFFLHGSGERGTGSPSDLNKLTSQGPPKHIKNGHNMCFTVAGKTECFIVLSMQTNDWDFRYDVVPFVKYCLDTYRIDPDRVYLTGLSMGAEGTWYGAGYSDNEPNLFAALAPMAGKAAPEDGCAIANRKIAVWAFHGTADAANPVAAGIRPVNGMIACNAVPAPIWTLYAGASHGGTWDKGYKTDHSVHNPNVYEWFLTQKKDDSKKPPVSIPGNPITITLPTTTATLNGLATDADGTIVSVLWTKTGGPSGGIVTSPNTLTTTITGLQAGNFTYALKVTDNDGLTSTNLLALKVNATPTPTPPVVNCGADKNITLPTNSISVTASAYDSDGSIVSYSWARNSGPSNPPIGGQGTNTLSVSPLMAGTYFYTLTVTDNAGLTGSDNVAIYVAPLPSNIPPVANAGADKSIILPINTVTIVGTGTDADGSIASYAWTQSAGPNTATIASPATGTTAMNGLIQGVYTFNLKVTDNKGATHTDQVVVTVNPIPANALPVTNAGTDITITLPVATTTLNGNATDADGTISTYAWIQTSGPNTATIVSPANKVTVLNGLIEGNYVFTLTATDNSGGQGSDQVLVQVKPIPPNQPPVANAGTDKNVTLPITTTTLTGGGTDSDGSIAQYKWTQKSGPNTATLTTPAAASTGVSGLIVGLYTFELEVTDDKGAKGSDQVSVNVFPAVNVAPVAAAGTDINITLPTSSTPLTGSGTDSDGTIVAYLWEQVSGPSTATFSSTTTGPTTVSALTAGIYIFSITVTDDDGAKGADQVKVTVAPQPPNIPPIANAGPDKNLTLPTNSTTLVGGGTDPDGTIVGYHWSLVSGPSAITLSDVDLKDLDVSNLVEGIYVFSLVIQDDRGAIATDEVKIFVNAADKPPVANAGTDKNITLPTNSAVLTGSGTDPDGVIVTYEWEQVSGPSASTLSAVNTPSITVSNLLEGIYVYGLRVIDDDGINDYDEVRVIVNPLPPNNPPVANTGPDIEITLPVNSVSVTGSGTDSDGTIAGYKWEQISGPNTATATNLNVAAVTFSNLAEGSYVFRLTVTDNKGAKGQKDLTVKVNPLPANAPPVANAGVDAEITLPTSVINLNGSGTDSDGSIASYAWTQINGPLPANFSSPATANTIALNLVEGIYVFRLTVTDNKGVAAFDEVKITVKPIPANLPPIANAGGNKVITLPASTTSLAGSATDADGSIAGYSWSQISGPNTATTSSLTAPTLNLSNLVAGIYLFRLTVTDNDGSTGFDEVNVRVQPLPANQPPTANGGGNKVIAVPATSVVFTGSGSDPDGTIAGYAWTQISGPTTATLGGAATNELTASALDEGTYIFRLTVTDDKGATGFDEVNVRVNPELPNQPPIGSAGLDQIITLPTNSVTLNGSGSDPDGTVTFAWTQSAGPSTATLAGATTTALTASALVKGVYTFRLTITDNGGLSTFDEVNVQVDDPALNDLPVANAGIDQTLVLPPASSSLTGVATDSDGTIANTKWEQTSGPTTATLGTPNALTTTVTGLNEGTYVFRFTVTDDVGDEGLDEMIITVKANLAPIAFAGDPVAVDLPASTADLAGGGTDPDGTVVSYVWEQVDGPTAATIMTPTQASTTLQGLAAGVYTFGLTVTDDKGAEGYSETTVTVTVPGNLPPVAHAGDDASIELSVTNSITLTGTGEDPDGTIASYEWVQLSGPGDATLTDNTLPEITASDLIEGVYIFELTVTDNGGLIAKDEVQVTVVGEPPVATMVIPKIFSPNGDGNNDFWTWPVTDLDTFQGCKLIIFNRFGKKVYETTSYDNSWNGKSSDGNELEEEAYYYVLKCDDSEKTGGVRIVR